MDKVSEQMPVPENVANLNVAFLPPMSGLASNETRLDTGAINVRVGEGRTAEVLRNLCYQIVEESGDPKNGIQSAGRSRTYSMFSL